MSAPAESCALVLTTASSDDEAATIARGLVERKLAACVNISGPIRSIYRWKGEICSAEERLLVIKTTEARFTALRDAIVALHSYETPEVVLIPIARGSDSYLRWVLESVGAGAVGH